MKTLLLAIAVLLCTTASAQIPAQKTLVADETWILPSGKNSFRLVTSNDSISLCIVKELKNISKYSVIKKTDRHGPYWEYSYYFENKEWNTIVVFVNKINAKPR